LTLTVKRTAAVLIAFCCLLISLANIAVPLLMAAGAKQPAVILWTILGPLCHQKFERSLVVLNWQMGLCTRCSAIFFFAFLAAALLGLRPRLLDRRGIAYGLALALMAPMLVEVALTFVFNHDFSSIVRIMTGAPYGCGAAVLVTQLSGDAWTAANKCRVHQHTGENL
jgi:uncharacterized membrane protein